MTTTEPPAASLDPAPVRQPAPPRGVLRALLGLPVHFYHARLGVLLGHRLIAPIVRAVIGRLVGWRYDGTPAARRRVVEQLPLIAFRPRGSS